MRTNFRLVLDPPYSFATEPGFSMVRHCHDFRPDADDLSDGCFRDPITGLVMLKPSYHSDTWYTDDSAWWKLTDWDLAHDFWGEVNRSIEPGTPGSSARWLTTKDPGTLGGQMGIWPILGVYGITLASVLAQDVIAWVAQSKEELLPDEGFIYHYQVMSDRFHRYKNWFTLQWADILMHFSFDGTARCYRYLDGLENAPTLIDTFSVADPGEIIGQEGSFAFIPIPGYGLAVYHNLVGQKMSGSTSSAQSGVHRGHMIPLPTIETEDGLRVLTGSKLSIGLARSLILAQHVFGLHRIRYPESGTFLDNVFDPGYTPSVEPTIYVGEVNTIAQETLVTGCTGEARKSSNPAEAWSTGTTKQGRVLHTLSTSNPVYTPFVYCSNAELLES